MYTPRRNGGVDTSEIGPGDTGTKPKQSTGYDPNDPVQRYMGIVIAVLFVLLIFLLWVYFANYPRRKLRQWGCTCISSPDDDEDEKEQCRRDTMSGSQQHLGPLGADEVESQRRSKRQSKRYMSGVRPPSPVVAAPLQSRDLFRYHPNPRPPRKTDEPL